MYVVVGGKPSRAGTKISSPEVVGFTCCPMYGVYVCGFSQLEIPTNSLFLVVGFFHGTCFYTTYNEKERNIFIRNSVFGSFFFDDVLYTTTG